MIFKSRGGVRVVLLLLVFSGTVNCGAGGKSGPVKFETRELVLQTRDGRTVAVTAEIARTDAERAQGLMNRKSLDDGKGMLFVFERDQILNFWMKNTLIPLSIAFISHNGRILEIRDMKPRDLNTVASSRSARYALEAPLGWFDRERIGVGDFLNPEDW
jgi:uncharacterized membrane protein (UPF0127 family)